MTATVIHHAPWWGVFVFLALMVALTAAMALAGHRHNRDYDERRRA